MMNIRIRFYLDGGLNRYTLDARSNDFGVLIYHLAPRGGGMSHCLTNMQLKRDLPATVHNNYSDVTELADHIKAVVNSGVYRVAELVFALDDQTPPVMTPTEIHTVLFEDLGPGAGSRGEQTTGVHPFSSELKARRFMEELHDLDNDPDNPCRITYHKGVLK